MRLTLVVLAAVIAAATLTVRFDGRGAAPVQPATAGAAAPEPAPAVPASRPPAAAAPDAPTDGYGDRPSPVRISIGFKRPPPRSALLFDLETGQVLWSRGERRRQPVASLAKMMTAIVVADRTRPQDGALITPEALATDGSKVGMLPPRRRVEVETLLNGLLLASGNDAAVALAQHVGRSVPGFVAEMNATGERLGLTCTSFSSPDGLQDAGNTACVRDLAVLAREVLARPRLAAIVGSEYVALPALIPKSVKRKGKERTLWRPGRLHLSNHNPLVRAGYRGITGVKTGYTDAAGRCLVATVRRGDRELGLVLLHSPDPGGQATRIFDRGFAALAAVERVRPGVARAR